MKLSKKLFFSASMKDKKRKRFLIKVEKKKNLGRYALLISRLTNPNLVEIVNGKELYRLDGKELHVCLHGVLETHEEAIDYLSHTVQKAVTRYGTINKEILLMELERDEEDII